jgi:hypothetical protein
MQLALHHDCAYSFTSTQLCVLYLDLFTDGRVIHTKNASNVFAVARDDHSESFKHCFSTTFLEKKNRDNSAHLDALMTERIPEEISNHLYGRIPMNAVLIHELRKGDGIGSQFIESTIVIPTFLNYVLSECRKLDQAICTIECKRKLRSHYYNNAILISSCIRWYTLPDLIFDIQIVHN